MAASAFHPISTALTLVSQNLAEVAASIPQGTSGAGATAEALAAKLESWRDEFNAISEHMSEQVAGAVEVTAEADDELTRHPSPLQVEQAEEKAMAARKMLMAKQITVSAFKQVADEAQAIREEREEAVKRHRETIRDMDKFEPSISQSNSLAGIDPYARSGTIGGLGGGGIGGGGGLGGGIPATGIGTRTSMDTAGGVPQPPAMPPMQPVSQPVGGGETPQPTMSGAPQGGMPGVNPSRSKRRDDKNDAPTGLSADLGTGAIAATATAPEGRGGSVRDVVTKADTSGVGTRVGVGATPGAGGGAGGAGGGRGGGMMGGPMGSPLGSGAGLKSPKPKPLIYSTDRDLLGDSSVENAVHGGLISRESEKREEEK